jgi:hypothetical protein
MKSTLCQIWKFPNWTPKFSELFDEYAFLRETGSCHRSALIKAKKQLDYVPIDPRDVSFALKSTFERYANVN